MPDAGVKPSDHYRSKMAPFRAKCREIAVETIRKETGILATMQQYVRSPLFDQYFALTANLGTHLFYMIFLPLFFWFDALDLGRDFVWGLALGVYFTGAVKDWFCLPRPLSPPVHRISMSGSACLEYGFPSTHSCNAITVALILLDHKGSQYFWPIVWLVATIIIGRLYSGMHGFLDVTFGSLMGVLVYFFRVYTKPLVDRCYDLAPNTTAIFGLLANSFIFTIHPVPVDDCPCFDDTVAFLSVLWGIETFSRSWQKSFDIAAPTTILNAVLRFVIGVAIIIGWRIVAKKTLLKVIPPLLRKLEDMGLSLPRKYYTPATEYDEPKDVPSETILDSPTHFKETVSNIRRARGRSDSVGPQSQHDYYEAMDAYNKNGGVRPEMEKVVQPRKRYDAEVITKVIVYSGISCSVFWASMSLFKLLGI